MMFIWIEKRESRAKTSLNTFSLIKERSRVETEIRTWSNLKMKLGIDDVMFSTGMDQGAGHIQVDK